MDDAEHSATIEGVVAGCGPAGQNPYEIPRVIVHENHYLKGDRIVCTQSL